MKTSKFGRARERERGEVETEKDDKETEITENVVMLCTKNETTKCVSSFKDSQFLLLSSNCYNPCENLSYTSNQITDYLQVPRQWYVYLYTLFEPMAQEKNMIWLSKSEYFG